MADRRLQVFHTVARLLSFTRAAEALHMTQPAVTFQVRQLEEQFDARLFDRAHNRIELTEAGRRVYEHAGRILDLYALMESDLRELAGDHSGALLLGASTTLAEYVLPGLLGQFARRHPAASVRLRVSNTEGVVRLIEDNEIDLGVVEGPVANRRLVVEVCHLDRLVVVMPPGHPLAGETALPARTLLEWPFVAREEGSGTREVLLERLRQCRLDPDALNIALELGSPEAIKGAVAAGMGISVLSLSTLAKELALGTLHYVALDPPLERPFSFVHRRQKFRSHVVLRLLDEARAWFAAGMPMLSVHVATDGAKIASGGA